MCDVRSIVAAVADELGVSQGVANELVLLGGKDYDLIVQSSRLSQGLEECKSRIIDRRFSRLEAAS